MNQLVRASDQALVVKNLKMATSYFTRLRGLIGVKNFELGEGLLFPRCNNIHMWMMSVPIDVVFLKVNRQSSRKEWVVLSVRSHLKPWKLLPVSDMKADDVLELPAGSVESFSLKSGEVLCIAS